MTRRLPGHRAAALITAIAAALSVMTGLFTAPSAGAVVCNDVEVVFARGTKEPPGIGRVGEAFVSALRERVPNRSLGVYAVNYPASYDFLAAADGANDASAYIQNVVNTCPATRLVLGGYSQGAAIIDVITSVPFPAIGFTNPLPPTVADRVAALAVFGNPSTKIGMPLTSSPLYGFKSIDLCNPGDPICSDGNNVPAHRSYGPDGSAAQAAAFVANLL
ncbi:MAG TPA: cutinase family protein [Mycobacterium sp.]|nr:MAG: cutinase family protein [Mycobacterium sp.]HOB50661.1 cutinase family protein [Mycobacterium sp.]HPZ94328.1 cutinase family protein [Mycobacterium sp.]HQE15946.1 cutinase family protein [Mycobacterium sp.]